MPLVFPPLDICENCGADPQVRGRPLVGLVETVSACIKQQERDEGVPRRPGGLPHLISAGIPHTGKLGGI